MLRLLLTPRWLGWTLLAVVAVVTCAGMSYWQLGRAESPTGSLLNAGYAFQWPLFGLFFAALWWRMLRAEARQLAGIREGHAEADDQRGLAAAGSAAGVSAGAVASWRGAGPARPSAPSSPFTPRPRGTEIGDGQGVVVPGSARAELNAYLAELARRDDAATSGPGTTPDPERRA